MRFIIILLLSMTLIASKSEQNQNEMHNEQSISETVTKLFIHTDNRTWSEVEAQFAETVNLDYSSMTGNPSQMLSPKEITTAWKSVLPGFEHTHHQIGNFIVETNSSKAHVFCYGTATHFLGDANGNVWTVVGSYDFDLEHISGSWKITSMTFNYKYQDGSSDLIQKAITNVKKSNTN